MTRIFVDFNDIEDGRLSALAKHADDPGALAVGSDVLLVDEEGNSALGHIMGLEATGFVHIDVVRSTWRSRLTPPAIATEQLDSFLGCFATRHTSSSFAEMYRLWQGQSQSPVATATPTRQWHPTAVLPSAIGTGAVPSSV